MSKNVVVFIEKVENENELVISPETTDIILTAFLDTVADILSEDYY